MSESVIKCIKEVRVNFFELTDIQDNVIILFGWVWYMLVCTCQYMCRGQRRILGVLCHSHLIPLRHNRSLNLGLDWIARG